MRSDEDLAKLSERLLAEVRQLPDDGEDHELIIKIKGDHGNINLGTQNFEIHSGKQLPPPGSDRERECPQCGQSAWRYTQHCMHCNYDMLRHDRIVAEELAERRKGETSLLMLKIFGGCVGVAVTSYFVSEQLPASMRGWAIGITAVSGFLAFAILQAHR